MQKRTFFIVLSIFLLFCFRLIYGLCSEFWFDDELQIYLIGLKSYTTQTWPFYGPDVVYTNTQIPGALQGLLVAVPLYILPIPEAPHIFLNLLTFSVLLAFAGYISKRIEGIPFWLTVLWLMLLTWTMDYGTRVVNPSYVLIFSIPFFISLFELLPFYNTPILSRKVSFFLLGLAPACIMQLHLSFVLLFPLIALVFFFELKTKQHWTNKLFSLVFFALGFLTGILTLIPTFLQQSTWSNTASNIVFNIEHLKNIFTVLFRYLFFASFEVSYVMGGSNALRLDVLLSNIWAIPFTVFLWVYGFVLVLMFLFTFFKKEKTPVWNKVRLLTAFLFVLTFISFFFSVKGPSSHTFYIVFPMVVFYSFYCHQWLMKKFKLWKPLMYAAIISAFFFYVSMGIYNYQHKSLYKNRAKVEQAIKEKNYKILGLRRADNWGYGY